MPPKKSSTVAQNDPLEGEKDEGTGRRRTRQTTQKRTAAPTASTKEAVGQKKSTAQKKKKLPTSKAPKKPSPGKAKATSEPETLETPQVVEGSGVALKEPAKPQRKRARADNGAAAIAAATSQKKIKELEAQVVSEWLAVEHEDDRDDQTPSGSVEETDCEVIDVVVSEDESGGSESDADSRAVIDRQETIKRLNTEIDALKKGTGKSKGKGKGKPNDGGFLPLASGLKPDFLAAKQKTPAHLRVQESVGLADNDIEDSPPADGAIQAKPLPHGSQRVNSMVTALAEPDIQTHTTVRPQMKVKRLAEERARVKAERSTEPRSSKEPVPLRAPKASKRAQELDTVPTSSSDTALASGSVASPNDEHAVKLLASTARVSHLPPFANLNQEWRLKFLPTLYLIFYTSWDTFKGFALSSQSLLKTVQDVVKTVYPHVTYPVKMKDDAFYLLAYNRINDRRAAISNSALERLSAHLKAFRLTSEAHDFLMWARRLDGPLFFKEPTPASCKVSRDDPSYIAPSGRLRSPFVVDLVRDALSHSKNAVRTPASSTRYPIGLFALVMVSLERAAAVLTADGATPGKMKKFSEENYGAQLKTYVSAMNAITPEQWDEILEEYDIASEDTDDPSNISIADNDRLNVFSFESPQKRR